MTQPKDQKLVRQTKTGDHEAYKELVARYQGHVYGLAYSLVGNWTDAQDIAQETFIRAYANIGQLKDPARFAALHPRPGRRVFRFFICMKEGYGVLVGRPDRGRRFAGGGTRFRASGCTKTGIAKPHGTSGTD